MKIFPEREREITIWDRYCDERGNVTKNKEEYKEKGIRV